MVSSTTTPGPANGEAGDVLLKYWRDKGVLTATVLSQDGPCQVGSGVLLRSKGDILPEFFAEWFNLPYVHKPIVQRQLHLSASGMMFSWAELKTLQIAVPDLSEQTKALEAIRVSGGWLRSLADNHERLAETERQMASAIIGQIFEDKLDRKGALLLVAQAMRTQMPGIGQKAPEGITGQEAAMKHNDGERFITVSEHQKLLAQHMAEKNEPAAAEPGRAGPRP